MMQGFPWQQFMPQQPQAVATAPQAPQGALQAMQQRLPQQVQQAQAPNTGPQMPFPAPPQVPMQGFNPFLGAYSSNFRQNVPQMQLPMPGFGYQGFYNIPGVTPPPAGATGREPPPEVVQTRKKIGGNRIGDISWNPNSLGYGRLPAVRTGGRTMADIH